MQEHTTRIIYNIWAHFYDPLLTKLVQRRQEQAISRMDLNPGEWLLDIGIGTGLSLPFYSQDLNVVGLDISEGMLGKAKRRIEEMDFRRARLALADAMRLPFEDDSFDHILVSHVITVVSDPIRLIDEIRRVGKPGCRIVVINHFQSGNSIMALLEKWLCPLCQKIGWRSDLALEDLMVQTGLDVDFRYKLDNVDLWETVFITNTPAKKASDAKIPSGISAA
ncbi:MAG: methyltransferase domain-containing protein [Phycisphaerae bacterium]|nr:methyltransferase domain-containing protein [Phycisphaerae bacterium]